MIGPLELSNRGMEPDPRDPIDDVTQLLFMPCIGDGIDRLLMRADNEEVCPCGSEPNGISRVGM